jgi:hypothetical protein
MNLCKQEPTPQQKFNSGSEKLLRLYRLRFYHTFMVGVTKPEIPVQYAHLHSTGTHPTGIMVGRVVAGHSLLGGESGGVRVL